MRKNFDSRRSAVPRFARGIALLLGATLLAAPNLAHAHFSTVIPQSPNGERGKPLNCLFFWGHPYEHVIFETPAPSSLVALAPSGARATLTTVAEGSARRFRFAPKERGDHLVLLTSPRYEVDDEVLQDH
ncbi:MAG: hypothetical protein KC466_08930, partial [Myxococcales bacterium]|nr:hypothetical protein [Myxococcales bacterium]